MKDVNHSKLFKKLSFVLGVKFPKHFAILEQNQKNYISFYLSISKGLIKSRGDREAVRILKLMYNESLNYSLNLPIENNNSIPWLKRNPKDNFLKISNKFKVGLRTEERRMILTIMRSFECFELDPIPDLSSVVEPSNGEFHYRLFLREEFYGFLHNSQFGNRIKRLFKERFEDHKAMLERKDVLHYSTKTGVEGKTLPTAGKQSLAIDINMKSNLGKLSQEFNRSRFMDLLDANQLIYKDNDDFQKTTGRAESYQGRITFVSAPGGKTRLVAIGNYWIQDSLKQIHDVIYSLLRRLPCDGLYDQDSSSQRVKRITSLKKDIWSFDLTKATDRFPILPQSDVLRFLNSEIGEAWNKILTSMKFEYKGKQYNYRVGQPMGLYSSWAVFSITHHAVIQFCASKVDKRYKSRGFFRYAILGDDVVIWHKEVAELYRRVIELLEVEISDSKSFFPSRYNPSGSCIAEFAKRLFVDGKEVTPVPPELIDDAFGDSFELPEYINFLGSRDLLRETLPVSRVRSLLGLSPLEELYLCLCFKIKRDLGAHIWGNLENCNSELLAKVTLGRLFRLRCGELVKQIQQSMMGYFLSQGQIGSALENLRDIESKYQVVALAVYDSLLFKVNELQQRISPIIPDFDEGMASEFWSPEEEAQTALNEIEFIPILSLEQIVNLGKVKPVRLRTTKGKFIRSLAEKILKTEGYL
jgi:hypothetical protein